MSIEAVLRSRRIRQLDLSPFLSVNIDNSLEDALAAMQASGSGSVLVIEKGQLAGIFTERDLLSNAGAAQLDVSKPSREFMTRNPDTLSPEDSVFKAIQLMDERGYRTVPLVEEDGRLAGILSVSNVVEFLAECFPQEVLALPPRAEQHFAAADGA
jgi:CBS domain-containing protein